MIMATVAAFLCWTGPGGTAWGQAYKNRYTFSHNRAQLRRVDALGTDTAFIGVTSAVGIPNVGKQLGAGESVRVRRNGTNEEIALNNGAIPGIHIGSDVSKNIVIRSYTGGGLLWAGSALCWI